MNPYRGKLLATAVLFAALPLFGCGDADNHEQNGGSGSYLRVITISPSNFEPDIIRTLCKTTVDPTTGVVTDEYEANNVTNHYASVAIANQSAPTTPAGAITNSYVTLSHYRVRFTGVSQSVNIPDINEGGWSTGIEAGSTATMTVIVMDLNTLAFIRDHYWRSGKTMTIRANITIWGKDAFGATVETEATVMLVVADYTTCSA